MWRPGAILLDIALPGADADGIELSRRLRAEPATARIPIVAMSGHAELEATGMPADARLAKPFGLEELEAAVARWMGAGA